jgi:hypothetical protein
MPVDTRDSLQKCGFSVGEKAMTMLQGRWDKAASHQTLNEWFVAYIVRAPLPRCCGDLVRFRHKRG